MNSNLLFAVATFDSYVVDLTVKSTFVLALAAVMSFLLTYLRSSAATRHLVWSLAIIAVLLLPALTAAFPSFAVSVNWKSRMTVADDSTEKTQPTTRESKDQLVMAWSPSSDMPLALPTEVQSQSPKGPVSPFSLDALAPATIVVRQIGRPIPWLYITWSIGCALALLPAGLGLISLHSLARRSRPVTNGRLQAALRQAAQQLGVTTLPQLLESGARTMPMTWGLWKSTILLPSEAHDWSDDRLHVVLLHELAHVQRRDCLIQTFAQVARAVYWFNPLVWLAERSIRVEQELACDDRVLEQGLRPSLYAEHLLIVLANARTPACATALGLAMARRSKLERRLRSILGTSENRQRVTRQRLATVTMCTMLLLGMISAFHIQTVQAEAEAKEPEKKSEVKTTEREQPPVDRVKLWAELRAKIADQYVGVIDDANRERGAIKGMLQSLGDPYSDFMTAESLAAMEKQIGGNLIGIGVQLEVRDEQIRVVTPLPGSPALQAGIQPGDVLVQIDGRAIESPNLGEVVQRIAGREGTAVKLKVRRDGAEKDIEVTRGSIKIATVKGFRRGADNQWNYLLNTNPKIGYVQVAQFGSETPKELRQALESLKEKQIEGLILDLRFCPGGLLDAAINSAKLFVSNGILVSLHGRSGDPITLKADAPAFVGDLPLVVLVNNFTASAAEVVAGALQDNDRAIVVGTRTHGKGSVQTLIKLADTVGAIRLTTSSYHLPSGRNIDRQVNRSSWGVNPNEGYFIPMNAAETKTLSDRRMTREILGSQSAQKDPEFDITPAWLKEQAADPQLAGALVTLTNRVKSGSFTKVSEMTPAQIEQFVKRQEIEQRREEVLKELQTFDRELAELDK